MDLVLRATIATVWCIPVIALTMWLTEPVPIRANPPPTALCLLDEDTVIADGTQLWPGGFAVPCKWLKKEQSV